MPAFSSPVDCTPWVIGGLWPAELSPVTDETATLAEYLEKDLQRIAGSANKQLGIVKRAGLTDAGRRAAEARVVDEARARAVRRVESTIRRLEAMKAQTRARRQTAQVARRFSDADLQTTQVIPAVAANSEVAAPALDETRVIPVIPATEPDDKARQPQTTISADGDGEVDSSGGRHRAPSEAGGAEPQAVSKPVDPAAAPVADESDSERLHRLLAFVVRQEPGLNWAVGDLAEGTTVLVTDLAHGWIPPGITLPEGVRLLAPGRRSGKASALLGEVTRIATYTPGDPVGQATDSAPTESSVRPRELPAVEDLGWELGRVTHWRDGLPRLVHTLAKAATAGTGVVEEEADLLRVHLDTARYQLLSQYPNVVPALLLNCLLLAATESCVAGDTTSANYHLAWFQKLAEPPASQWTAGT